MTGRLVLLSCVLFSAAACRAGARSGRAPAPEALPAAAPEAPLERRRVEYFRISDGCGMCQRVIANVRALLSEEPYRSRFSFEVFGWETPEGEKARAAYPFGAERHGLVVLAADGRLLRCRAGHFYGAGEIREDLDRALGR